MISHSCHRCANEQCPFGMRGEWRKVKGGCEHYIKLDPLLVNRRWQDKNGNDKPRMRKTFLMYMSVENVDFIENVVIPSDPKKINGYFSRAVRRVIEFQLSKLGDEIPIIPKADRGDYSKELKNISLYPNVLNKIMEIKKRWDGTRNKTSKAAVIEWMITTTREAVEAKKLEAENGNES